MKLEFIPQEQLGTLRHVRPAESARYPWLKDTLEIFNIIVAIVVVQLIYEIEVLGKHRPQRPDPMPVTAADDAAEKSQPRSRTADGTPLPPLTARDRQAAEMARKRSATLARPTELELVGVGAVYWCEVMPCVRINHRLHRVGDEVAEAPGYRVVRIERTAVVLIRPDGDLRRFEAFALAGQTVEAVTQNIPIRTGEKP